MKIIRHIRIFVGLTLTAALTACSERPLSDTPHHGGQDVILAATIAGSESATRAVTSNVDANSTHTRFDKYDAIGFYSGSGNVANGGDEPFVNAKLVCDGTESGSTDNRWRGLFKPVDMEYDIGLIKNNVAQTFAYYPYTENMETEGMELRQLIDGVYRCIDALTMSTNISVTDAAMLSGSFNHAFSEVVILRGYGFDDPPLGDDGIKKDGIKVVTTLPYSHAKVVINENDNHKDWKILKPVFDEERYESEAQKYREWEAWDGEPYIDDSGKEFPAKYVIIPTAISGDRSTVNYVELYDNFGTLHKVTSFGLMNEGDKRVSPNERYYLTIKLEGLQPTIYPFAITPWAEEERYTEQRATGINTPTGFEEFVREYNRYNERGRNSAEVEEILKKYGDKHEDNGVVSWHFYINNDLDFSSSSVDNLRITTLRDIIDGRTRTIKGIKSDKAFINEMSKGAEIRNLKITGLNITSQSADFAGGLIHEMNGGLITGCNVDGDLKAQSAAGLAVGHFTAGTIKDCSFSGLVVGASSSYENGYFGKGLIGVGPGPDEVGSEMFMNINTAGLLFRNN